MVAASTGRYPCQQIHLPVSESLPVLLAEADMVESRSYLPVLLAEADIGPTVVKAQVSQEVSGRL